MSGRASRIVRFRDRLAWLAQGFDYGVLLPASARLPLAFGRRLASGRGRFNAAFDRDWRSLTLRRPYVRRLTYEAMKTLRPDASERDWNESTVGRFVHSSIEEWEGAMCDVRPMNGLSQRSRVIGIEPLLQAQRAGRGLMLLSLHYGSFPSGVILLGLLGLRVHGLCGAIVEDPRVHPATRSFFAAKYRGLERYMNGGRMVFFERSPRYFYRVLKKGEAVIIMADLQSPARKPFEVSFLGAVRRMAPGPVRIARKTKSLMSAYVCVHEGGGYRLECSPVVEAEGPGPAALYRFLERFIREHPEQWWAADLLPRYGSIE